jgi:predicted enzyme related to lactoylglutathione lyase
MKKTSVLILLLACSFGFGYAFKSMMGSDVKDTTSKPRVTGIGGIFFKCSDTKKVKEWYQKNLGINTNQYGSVFEWYQGADSTKKGFSQWSPFSEKTTYFLPSTKEFMINYRVNNLDALVTEMKKNGVNVLDTMQVFDYGKFVHVLDPEGNKIELWEPNDKVYEQMGITMGLKTTK